LSDRFNIDSNLDVLTNDRAKTKSLKAFDGIKAAKIIKENNIQNARIGLTNTLDDTIPILQNGKPIKITGICFCPVDSNPFLINNDSGVDYRMMCLSFILNTSSADHLYFQDK